MRRIPADPGLDDDQVKDVGVFGVEGVDGEEDDPDVDVDEVLIAKGLTVAGFDLIGVLNCGLIISIA